MPYQTSGKPLRSRQNACKDCAKVFLARIIKGCENLGKLFILSFLLLSASRAFYYFCVCQAQHCDQCQKTKRKFGHPAEELHPVPVPNSSWKQIGIDLIGPLPTTTNGNKYVIVVTDYFSKWPEHVHLQQKKPLMLLSFLMTSFFVMGALM